MILFRENTRSLHVKPLVKRRPDLAACGFFCDRPQEPHKDVVLTQDREKLFGPEALGFAGAHMSYGEMCTRVWNRAF